MLAPTVECANCGRRFIGSYCPGCGQAADPPRSVLGVLSVFFREMVDISGGLWPTLRALTIRPGEALSQYLRGARQSLMHPGRYLLAAIVVSFGAGQAFTLMGVQAPYARWVVGDIVDKSDPEMSPEMAAEIQSVLLSVANRILESQTYLVASNVALTGLFALVVWRLFQGYFERGAQAASFAAFVIAHTAFLETTAELLYVPLAYLSSGAPAGLPVGVSPAIAAIYVATATSRAFGGSWRASAKGLFALGWASLERAVLTGLGIGAYTAWLMSRQVGGGSPPEESSSEGSSSAGSPSSDSPSEGAGPEGDLPSGSFEISFDGTALLSLETLPLVAVMLIPFVLHAGAELYYRAR